MKNNTICKNSYYLVVLQIVLNIHHPSGNRLNFLPFIMEFADCGVNGKDVLL